MIKIEWFYWLCAALFLVVAVIRLLDTGDRKRFGSAAFWAILAFTFVYGTFVVNKSGSALVEGIAVLALAALAGCGFPGRGSAESVTEEQKEASARRFGNKLFIPALLIPLIAVIFGAVLKNTTIGGTRLLEEGSATIIGLGVASLVALVAGMAIIKVGNPMVPMREGDRLLGHIGWAAILPQFLATLGLLFNQAGVGKAVGEVTGKVLPHGLLLPSVIVYCVGMAVFTIIMGNAFAAFPVMTAAIGWPLLVQQFHGNPPAVFAVGMLAGFCGTLVTPMAANFNLVPAALLELKDQYGPIKAQIPTAIPLLLCNIVIMYLFCFPR
ncbi:DUF979 domain-containing protein [Calidifontibacter sp. DB0510]|uniref:DUF979 domain-containing protein n=1 Tax=Metallococcus carri TaxID=1656884 RepID=A0A967B2Z7_9MICO|nr:DUF979 domain-containing protein [Metallococcus carri]NHN56335.1 DUF979 domain-containing protein [Metallococcus carri]NOP35959.1 DUF979 family protein [Calidifontibacter sp. DB2511S]